MKDIVAGVLGRKSLREETASADVVPVVATVPDERYSQRERGQVRKKKRSRMVASILGRMSEAEDEETPDGKSIFPDDAKEVDSDDAVSGPSLHGVKTIVEPRKEPAAQSDEAELLTPESALVAPDVTPMAYTPINPTKVPTVKAPSFSTGDANQEPSPGSAMDTMLGRSEQPLGGRPSSIVPPAADPYAALNIQSPATMEAQGEAIVQAAKAMTPGGGMPDHKAGTGAKVMESFRRFTRL